MRAVDKGRRRAGPLSRALASKTGLYSGGISKAQSFSPDRFGGSTPATAGLSFFRNRAYDARTGRWTQEDPIGVAGGVNLYQFNGNDPVMFTDPFGLCPPEDANDGPHCWMTAGATSATPGELQSAVDESTRASQKGVLNQIVGAVMDFVGNRDDMMEANTIGGDKYFHCKANCQATQRGPAGEATAGVLSDVRELTDQVRGTPADSSVPDQTANKAGRDGGRNNPNVPCSNICATQRPRGLDSKY